MRYTTEIKSKDFSEEGGGDGLTLYSPVLVHSHDRKRNSDNSKNKAGSLYLDQEKTWK